LQGQRACSDDFAYSDLISSSGNYAICRAQMKARPGLPFLFPYLREYSNCGDAVMGEVFSFVSYRMEAALAQSAGKTGFSRYLVARMRRLL